MGKSVDRYAQKDKQLFAEVQKLMDGNFESYQNIYELSKNYIYKVIYDIVQDHYTTEDMMQETYLQVYNKIDSLREAQAFYVWAGRIASNLTLRYLQKYRHEVLTEAADDDGEDFIFDKMINDNEAFIPESVLENQEQQRIIAGILEGLSTEQRLTVQYFYYEEMSVNDIASLMECSTGTVKSRLNYARKSLKTAISQFETDNNVKLYSLSSLPIFFLVFKDMSEVLALAAGTAGAATVAGGAVGGGASVAGGSIGSGAAAAGGTVGGGAVAGNAGAAVSGVGAAAAGSAGGVGATGFLGTVAGKVAIAAAVVFLGGAAAFAVTLSLRNEPSDGNAVKQEYVEPSTIINDPEVDCIIEDIEVEPGSNLNSGIKYSYYDMEGNLLLYQVYEWAVIEEYGEEEMISSSYYYADGTPWDIREYSNYDYGDYPQYGWYGVETYTENNVRYYPDGTIYTHTSYEYANRHEVRENYYNADGSLRSYGIYEYAEVADNQWERIKGTRYNPDGSVRAYNTFEYDENGELTRDNFYNADGELQYYYISVYDETGVRQEGYNPDGTPRN